MPPKNALRYATRLAAGAAVSNAMRRIVNTRAPSRPAQATETAFRGGRTRTKTRQRRRKGETFNPVGEYTRVSVVKGRRPRKTLRAAWRLLNQNINHTVYGYRGWTNFGGTSGLFQLENICPVGGATGPFHIPLHVWELTSAPNVVNGTATYPVIFSRPVLSDPTSSATLSWSSLNSSVGVTSGQLAVETSDAATTNSSTFPLGSSTLEWVQAKMMFYAPLQTPCRYQIDIVQIKDTRLIPGETNQFATAFYQAMAKRFVSTPLEPGNAKYQKYLKVLKTMTFILNPKESTESVNTIFREVNLFLRLNRRCTYDWGENDLMNMLTQDVQTNTGQNIQTQVHPRARIFMIIRAQARNSTAFSTNLMPSYDVVVRAKHSQFSG